MKNVLLTRLNPFKGNSMVLLGTALTFLATSVQAGDNAQGALIANGKTIALPYVYLWQEEKGFNNPEDPTWKIIFVERPLETREIGEPVWDAAYVEIGLTETAWDDAPAKVEVYSQSIKLASDSAGNLSGGTYPSFELDGLGSEKVSGRIWQDEKQEFFDDSYQYDFTFSASLTDLNAPIGDILPAGGGEPGAAYLKWVEAVHSGDIGLLKSIVPADMGAQLDSASPEELKEQMEFLMLTTPTSVKVLDGSSDGETAIFKIEGVMEGETINAEVTMSRFDGFWIPTNFAM